MNIGSKPLAAGIVTATFAPIAEQREPVRLRIHSRPIRSTGCAGSGQAIVAVLICLLGTKPVWNGRGKVIDVEIIPTAQLKRPRIDIVIACAAEGMFNNITVLMDKAVQKVKALEGAENYVRRRSNPASNGDWDGLWVSLPVLGLLAAWRWRHNRASVST